MAVRRTASPLPTRLFAVRTTQRPEIVVYRSDDAQTRHPVPAKKLLRLCGDCVGHGHFAGHPHRRNHRQASGCGHTPPNEVSAESSVRNFAASTKSESLRCSTASMSGKLPWRNRVSCGLPNPTARKHVEDECRRRLPGMLPSACTISTLSAITARGGHRGDARRARVRRQLLNRVALA